MRCRSKPRWDRSRHPAQVSSNLFSGEGVSEATQAALTGTHSLGGLNNRQLCSRSSGGWKSRIKDSAGLASPEALPPGQAGGRFPAGWTCGLSSTHASLMLPPPLTMPPVTLEWGRALPISLTRVSSVKVLSLHTGTWGCRLQYVNLGRN